MIQILSQDAIDKDVKEEINYYHMNKKELKKFIVELKGDISLIDIDEELLEIKLSCSDYCYEDLMYYLFVLNHEEVITFDELKLLTGIVKKIEEDEGMYHESEKLSKYIDNVTKSLKDKDLNDFCNNYEEYIETPEQDYIYKRALFNLDVITTD